MTAFQWFTIVQTLVMALAAAGLAILIRGFRSGQWARSVGEERDKEVAAILQRIDQAGKKISDLASEVQAFPSRMHKEFVPREVFELEKIYSVERREAIREEFRRDTQQLWEALHQFQKGHQ